ncbi:hypothetical protein GBAR_LOCUS4784, partial [Geodia barretti]
PSTTYSIQVAAVNSAGTGVYSDPETAETLPSVYLSLDGEIITNHSYVDISDIGSPDNTALLCITNCPGSPTPGNWFAPSGARVGDVIPVPGFTRNRGPMVVRLKRTTGTAAEGIYHCVVMDNTETDWTVYVGIYNGGGDISTTEELTVKSDLNGASPQFTLTCISTGGPATTVTWTRDSTTVTQGTQTVLDDPVTAQYTHTLTVTTGGQYTCTVANNKPSTASASFTLQGPPSPTDVTAVQEVPLVSL